MNPYFKDDSPIAWELYEAGEQIESEAKDSDETVNAMDRRTAAIYKVGAAIANALGSISEQRADWSVGEDVTLRLAEVGEAIGEIAKALTDKTSGSK